MLKRFKRVSFVLISLTFNVSVFAQNEPEYKAVVLDGKPAKLNAATGEISLVNDHVKSKVITSKLDEGLNSESVSVLRGTSDFHIVNEGEGLLDVSRIYNVSLANLKQANQLESTLINKGQKLRVKNFHPKVETKIASKVDNKITNEEEPEEKILNFHIIKKDETLFSLSRRYKLSLNELKRINNLDTDVIKVGKKLRITHIEVTNDVTTEAIWVVSKGDTLYAIAKKSGTSVGAIKQLNGLTSNLVRIGEILKLK